MRQPVERKVSPHSLAAIIDAFLDWTQKHRSPDTYEWYRYRLQRFVERHPDLAVASLRPYHVQRWVDEQSLSTTTKCNYVQSVKRCLRWAATQGYIDSHPIASLEVPAAAEHRETALTQGEFDRLLSYAVSPEFRDLLIVTWETGCRLQELRRVEARHVDLKLQRWVFKTSESKGKRKSRLVYLTDRAAAIVKRRMFAHRTGPIFRNRDGRPWTPGHGPQADHRPVGFALGMRGFVAAEFSAVKGLLEVPIVDFHTSAQVRQRPDELGPAPPCRPTPTARP